MRRLLFIAALATVAGCSQGPQGTLYTWKLPTGFPFWDGSLPASP